MNKRLSSAILHNLRQKGQIRRAAAKEMYVVRGMETVNECEAHNWFIHLNEGDTSLKKEDL